MGENNQFVAVRIGKDYLLIKLSGIKVKIVGAIVFDNFDFIVLDENEVVGVGKPGKKERLIVNFGVIGIRSEVLRVGNMKIGVVFDVINIDVAGLDLTLLGLGALGGRRSDDIFGNSGVFIG